MHVLYAVRAFMENNDPKPAVASIKKSLKIYPYRPGGYGTGLSTILEGKVRPGPAAAIPPTKFIEASGKATSPTSFASLLDRGLQQKGEAWTF
jgi:hypothetical protein